MQILINEIKTEIQKLAKPSTQQNTNFAKHYLGTKRKFLNLKSAERDKILKKTIKEIKSLDQSDLAEILNTLFLSDTFEYVNFAGKLMSSSSQAKLLATTERLQSWIEKTSGWAECDSICQSLFESQDALKDFKSWQKMIRSFSQDKNIQLRRASLVLQVKPVGKSNQAALKSLAFETVEKLKSEKEVLITKAISWLLRALANHHETDLLEYLTINKSTLPAIAYRGTIRKINTGKK